MARKLVTGPRLLAALILLVLAGAIYLALRPSAMQVETGDVARGPMTVTVNDLAETRVRDLYVVSAPVTGELLRLPLKAGDRVIGGKTLLARIRPAPPTALDARSLAQTRATIASLQAQAASADARVQDALSAQLLAERQLNRVRQLREKGFVAQAALDEARSSRDRAAAATRAARGAEQAAQRSVEAARAGLIGPGGRVSDRDIVSVVAPVSGYVLIVPQESERVVTAGTPLVSLGNPASMELVTDLLSSDAVQVRPGATVSIEDWGGDRPLKGRVRLVEPYGFLKVSALGVEEQRVNVVMDFTEPYVAWSRLGHGFRATVRIATWSAPDVLRVPANALFRASNRWQAYLADPGGRARLVDVRVGRMNEDVAEVLGGLRVGDRVILHPGEKLQPGSLVTVRHD
jgi:HlyD family secretion protein